MTVPIILGSLNHLSQSTKMGPHNERMAKKRDVARRMARRSRKVNRGAK